MTEGPLCTVIFLALMPCIAPVWIVGFVLRVVQIGYVAGRVTADELIEWLR